jgi:hypothetical protein
METYGVVQPTSWEYAADSGAQTHMLSGNYEEMRNIYTLY